METYAAVRSFTTEEKKNEAIEKKRVEFHEFGRNAVVIPRELMERKTWKGLSANAKEIYRVLATGYDYENGIAKLTHNEIQNESGIGSRATIVKALRELDEGTLIVIVAEGSSNHMVRHHYLMPQQERHYAGIIGIAPRDFSAVYQNASTSLKKAVRKHTRLPAEIHPLFFRVCQKLLKLRVDRPERHIGRYADKGEKLRAVMFMCDASYIVQKHKIKVNGKSIPNAIEFLLERLSEDDVREDIYGKVATDEIRDILRAYKEKSIKR
ncbi:MAG: hypothetical protein AABZ39_00585 [Spirochaetota bacterium]